jgi:hypothetical protein
LIKPIESQADANTPERSLPLAGWGRAVDEEILFRAAETVSKARVQGRTNLVDVFLQVEITANPA